MSVLPVRLFGDPVLRTEADPVVTFDRELRTRAFSLQTGQQILDEELDLPAGRAINMGVASAALVYDNALFSYTSPFAGQRYRFQLSPLVGDLQLVQAVADFRRYFFVRPVTLALQGLHNGKYGRDSDGLIDDPDVRLVLETDADGRVWAGSSGGLVLVEADTVRAVFTTDDGLPANSVTDLIVDSRGVLWVTTDEGTARFDGHRFEDVGVGSESATAIAEDRSGAVWVGLGEGALVRYGPGGPERFALPGKHFELSRIMQPLAPYKDVLTVVSGTAHHQAVRGVMS